MIAKGKRSSRPDLHRQALTASAAILIGILLTMFAACTVHPRLRDAMKQAAALDPRRPIEMVEIAALSADCARFERDPTNGQEAATIDQSLAVRHESLTRLESLIDRFRETAKVPAEQAEAENWKRNVQACRVMLDRATSPLGSTGGGPAALDTNSYCQRMSAIAAAANTLSGRQLLAVEGHFNNLRSSLDRIGRAFDLRVVGLLSIVVLWSAWYFHRTLRRALTFSQAVEAFARGELSARISLDGNDELARAARQFNTMAAAAEARHRTEKPLSQPLQAALPGQESVQTAYRESTPNTDDIAPVQLTAPQPFAEPADDGGQEAVQEHGHSPLPAEITSSLAHYRVLVAEDGPDNRRLISFLLGNLGVDFHAVENGQQALEAVLGEESASKHEAAFDLILMDMQMPVLDGYQATRLLREAGYRGPIVALAVQAMRDDRQRCLDAGCDDCLTKPIDKSRLSELIERYINRATAAAGRPPAKADAAD